MTEREMKQRRAAARKARARKARNRRVVMTVALMLVVCIASVGGTIAWLQDTSAPVVNTFSPSSIGIDLTETVPANRTAKMVPGINIAKDPTVKIDANSEACWVFVKIEETENFRNFMSYEVADGWTALDATNHPGVYFRMQQETTEVVSYPVIKDNKVKVLDTVTKQMMDALTVETQPELTFTAYAIQMQGSGETQFTQAYAWETLNKPSGSGIIAGN